MLFRSAAAKFLSGAQHLNRAAVSRIVFGNKVRALACLRARNLNPVNTGWSFHSGGCESIAVYLLREGSDGRNSVRMVAVLSGVEREAEKNRKAIF